MSSQPASDLDQVRTYFRNFGLKQAPENGSPLYHALSLGVLNDPDMLRLAASCPPSQPSANLLFGAVHYLLLGGVQHPLRDFYPDVVASEEAPRPPRRPIHCFKILSGITPRQSDGSLPPAWSKPTSSAARPVFCRSLLSWRERLGASPSR